MNTFIHTPDATAEHDPHTHDRPAFASDTQPLNEQGTGACALKRRCEISPRPWACSHMAARTGQKTVLLPPHSSGTRTPPLASGRIRPSLGASAPQRMQNEHLRENLKMQPKHILILQVDRGRSPVRGDANARVKPTPTRRTSRARVKHTFINQKLWSHVHVRAET